MTPQQIRELALQLYTIVFESDGVAPLTVWQRCLRTCQRWDVEPPTAVLSSEALTGYLAAGWRPRTKTGRTRRVRPGPGSPHLQSPP
jgi:hypothetical protein